VHYNSWYDFTSWQDEGFFGPRSELAKTEQGNARARRKLLAELRKDRMTEKAALKVVANFGHELVHKRNITLDSFLWDDGWDDPEEGLWAFDRERFPRGFAPLASAAKEYGCGLGVWLSPWGGYGEGKEARLRSATAQGYETNKNGLSLAGPRYFARFKEAALKMQREAGANFFKFDGVAGDPAELAAEVEAILEVSSEIRAFDILKRVWINLTTGTWPSPFFLLWVDSIWRGHRDVYMLKSPVLEGLSVRQKWQVFRECIVYEFVAKQAYLFPLARLMIHGAVLAQHGDARALGLHQATKIDWAQEVWSHAAMGLLLQELYISTDLMTRERWDTLAEALNWSHTHASVLEDTHWALPVGCADDTFEPHSWAAWRGSIGFLTLRNPQGRERLWTKRFTLVETLELPAENPRGKEHRTMVVEIVKRLEPAMHGGTGEILRACQFLEGSSDIGDGRCSISAGLRTRVRLGGGELLLLQVTQQPPEESNMG